MATEKQFKHQGKIASSIFFIFQLTHGQRDKEKTYSLFIIKM